ncbi:hypothetical protein [Mycobacterium sp.]|nr:hypothetical protein [Mycobacterium sp.]HZA10023.1 hypothetical protein [Mycobacterium sp.]
MTFADVCPSIRWCRRSWGVIVWTWALLTAAENHPPDDFGRGR